MKRLVTALAKRDVRLVLGGMVVLAALVAFEAWHLFLRVPIAQYAQLRQSRAGLAAVADASAGRSGELERLNTELQGLVQTLKGELRAPQSDEQLTAVLMSELDRSAETSGATLKGVKPATRRTIAGFEEISYEIAAEGKYLTICGWLTDLERVLGGSAAVADFAMKATDTRQVAVTLKLAVYRPLPGQPK